MGAWGNDIFENDTASDVLLDWEDGLKKFDTKRQAMQYVIDRWNDDNDDWATLALADLQIEYNCLMYETIILDAISICQNGADLDEWRNPSERKIVYDKFLEKCNGFMEGEGLMGRRLPLSMWRNIFRNLKDMDEEDYYDGVIDWVEVMWLDGTDEWCLCYGEEMFEDGFASEKDAQKRLNYLEKTLL